ncbi:MAG: response regulator transcription factor [Saprospiraceae bacterium]|nr:response regulator transcription factor [Saprospiraceae bacterium]
MNKIAVLIADSQYLVRQGLWRLLSAQSQFDIVAEAANEEELIALLEKHRPDVVTLDYHQPPYFKPSTVQLIKTLAPQAHLLIISSDNNKNSIYQVLEYGANSFLTKTCGEQEIVDAVKAAAKGDKFFCSKVLDYILERSFSKNDDNCAPMPLSPREVEIVRLVAKGLIAKEIAGTLNLSTHTVYTHRKNIMKKLQLNTSSELVLYAVNQGIVEQEGVK